MSAEEVPTPVPAPAGGEVDVTPLPVVRPDWEAPSHVRALCTTRTGGVSAAPYDTLNLGLHVGDETACVHENRRRLVERLALPSTPVWLVQVHGDRVVRIDGSPDRGGSGMSENPLSADDEPSGSLESPEPRGASGPIGLEADGAWTERRGVVLAVLTADCLPVVVTDAAGTRVAVAHAGWRGLAGGVLEAALAPFPSEAELHVWLGPAIGPRAFEVGAEVRETFVVRDAVHEAAFVPAGAPGKFLADLYALARGELRRGDRSGAVHVTGGDRCTVRESACFHSHRRDGARSGRMATLAWLDGR